MNNKRMIVILPAGWVFVGIWDQRDSYTLLKNAFCIRRWGTKAGLGELALKGPRNDTILEPCGTLRFKTGTEIAAMECTTENWK